MAQQQRLRGETPLRLTPEMASRRLLVLAFVRDYIARWGESPSYGEIAAGVGVSRQRAHQLVRRLVATGQLLRTPGPRGLALPTVREDAVRQLRELGWTVDEDLGVARTFTDSTLLGLPPLTYLHPRTQTESDGDGKSSADESEPPSNKAAPGA